MTGTPTLIPTSQDQIDAIAQAMPASLAELERLHRWLHQGKLTCKSHDGVHTAARLCQKVSLLTLIGHFHAMGDQAVTATALSEYTGMYTSAISTLLEELQADGFIQRERERHPDTGRIILRLSPASGAQEDAA